MCLLQIMTMNIVRAIMCRVDYEKLTSERGMTPRIYILAMLVSGELFFVISHTLEDILTSNPDNIFYVCNHCNIHQ